MPFSTYDCARKYVDEYKWSVIPIRLDGSKAPALRKGEPEIYRTRYATDQELQRWFKQDQNGIAIVTGKLSNIAVIDVDTLKPLKEPISSCISVRTPKGKHLYFRYSPEVGNEVKSIPDIDFRSEGTYCIAPPTPGYRFINPYFKLSSLPDFPLYILPKEEKQAAKNGFGWIGEALINLQEGNRDDTFTSIIGRLHHDNYAPSDIVLLLTPYAESSGYGGAILEEKVNYLTQRYANNPPAVEREKIALSVEGFLEKEIKVEWLCYPFFAKQTLGFIVGLPEVLKSWLAMDLAIELSRGGKWLNSFSTNKSKVLFIEQERAFPEIQRRFKMLLAEKGIAHSELKENLFIDCSSHRKIDQDMSFENFKREIAELRPDVIIIDSFVTVHSTPENDRTEIQKVLDRLKKIREEFHCSTIFINHESKSAYQDEKDNVEPSAGRMVGSIGVVAAPESIISVKKLNATTSSIYHTKNNLACKAEPFLAAVTDTDKGVKILLTK